MDLLLFRPLLLLSFLSGSVFACKTVDEFKSECMTPYLDISTETFWQNICSVNGRLIFACIDAQHDCPSNNEEQSTFLADFDKIFGAFQRSIDYACEYKTKTDCQSVINCFTNTIFDYEGNTVYSFYEFFCGNEQHVRYMFDCTAGFESECPVTVQYWSETFQIVTPTRILNYSTLASRIIPECEKLLVSDVQCIQTKTAELAQCGIEPMIDIPNGSLICMHAEDSKSCITQKCGSTVATFYDELFKFIECGLNIDGQWGGWDEWSTCSKSCGDGTYLRTRACNNPAPAGQGKDCVGEFAEVDLCNIQGCPVDGGFGFWGFWSQCNVNCGGGTRTRTRSCNNPEPANGGTECVGETSESESCETQECTGVYGAWGTWGQCSVTCGTGTETRSRTCIGGNGCIGPSSESRNCVKQNCPVNGGLSNWGTWSTCTNSCGTGTRTRTRSCTNPAPAYGGTGCSGITSQTETCNVQTCPITQCPTVTNSYGNWPATTTGEVAVLGCQKQEEKGSYSRRCGLDGIWEDVTGDCEINPEILNELNKELERLADSNGTVSEDIENVVKNLTGLTEDVDSETSAETMQSVLQTAKSVVNVVENKEAITEDGTKNFLQFVSNIINPETEAVWNDAETEADGSEVLDMVDRYVSVLQSVSCDTIVTGTVNEYDNEYLYTEVGKSDGDVLFPKKKETRSLIDISAVAIAKKGISDVCFGGSVYKSIGNIIENGFSSYSTSDLPKEQLVVNSEVVSVQLPPVEGVTYTNLDPPVRVTFKPSNGNYSNPVCVYWDYNLTGPSKNGAWSSAGCKLVQSTGDIVVCECSHLTNFAVLMSPSGVASEHSQILSIISAVGCAISMVCLILTMVAHALVWRLVRSDRAIILMNLCVALLVALGVFLAGVNRTESRKACAAIAAIIQYLFLAVFFFMLLSGIEILICVVHVFVTKFRIKILLPVGWLAPALIVGISLGVTKTKGYGNDNFCWLDIDSGLIWSFIGPAAFIILVNFIIIAVVFKKMASSAVLKTKTSATKIKTGLRSLCVLLPLMGLTWVFGILSVNSDMFFLQYLFCIFNTLQGLFIFLFHCVFNRQIREAIKRRQERRRSLQTFSSDFRKQSRSISKDARQQSSSSERRSSDLKKNGVDNMAYVGREGRKKSEDFRAEDWDKLERKTYHKNIRKGSKFSS